MENLRRQAQQDLEDDFYAITTRAPREARLVTWQKFHVWWFGEDIPVLPLTVSKICRNFCFVQSRLLQVVQELHQHNQRSAHRWRLSLGWPTLEDHTEVHQIGITWLPGPSRSEPFDILDVVKFLESRRGSLSSTGPMNPLAMVVCATYFMLRQLEVSAIEMEDVVFTETSVSINLPVIQSRLVC